jgi:phage terminase large subunit
MLNRQLGNEIFKMLSHSFNIKDFKPNLREIGLCDSAEPKSIEELKQMDLNVSKAKKGPGSIETGIKFLQELEEIIIDRDRAPNAAREFSNAEFDTDKNSNVLRRLVPTDDHTIDATRYRLELETRNKWGWS